MPSFLLSPKRSLSADAVLRFFALIRHLPSNFSQICVFIVGLIPTIVYAPPMFIENTQVSESFLSTSTFLVGRSYALVNPGEQFGHVGSASESHHPTHATAGQGDDRWRHHVPGPDGFTPQNAVVLSAGPVS